MTGDLVLWIFCEQSVYTCCLMTGDLVLWIFTRFCRFLRTKYVYTFCLMTGDLVLWIFASKVYNTCLSDDRRFGSVDFF